eukprot:30968-Pelagococcus_subviridis.AAC.9
MERPSSVAQPRRHPDPSRRPRRRRRRGPRRRAARVAERKLPAHHHRPDVQGAAAVRVLQRLRRVHLRDGSRRRRSHDPRRRRGDLPAVVRAREGADAAAGARVRGVGAGGDQRPPRDARVPHRGRPGGSHGALVRDAGAFYLHWSPYDRVGVVNADP